MILKCLKDLLLEEILCCITYNIRKLRKLREYMKVKLRKFCEVMKIFRERSYENFYNPPSSDGGAQLERGAREISKEQFPF